VRGDGLIRAVAVAAIVAALYGGTLGHGLVWDDRLTAAAATAVGPALARTDAFYRPVVMLSFALDHALWGGAAWGFHLTNLVLHAAVSWSVGTLASTLGASAAAAFASALLFAAHPVQTEAVTYVSGRTDVLCALFAIVGLLLWRRARRPLDGWAFASAAAFLTALLCKESAVLVPLVLLVPGAHPTGARVPRPLLPLAVAGLWLLWFVTSTTVPLSRGDLSHRLPAIAGLALGYARLLVWPVGLHLERFVVVPGWSAPTALGAWLGVAVLAVVLVLLARRAAGGAVLLTLTLAAYAPVSGLVPVYPAVADRVLFGAEHFLYLPLVGLVPLFVGAWPVRARRVGPVVVIVLLSVWGWITIDRNRDWRDEDTLFRHTVRFDPPTARVWYNLANLRLAAGDLDEAERLYRSALARAPNDADAHWNLGITLQRKGRALAALEEYREAARLDPRLAAKLGTPRSPSGGGVPE
jgi:hypothetical protein